MQETPATNLTTQSEGIRAATLSESTLPIVREDLLCSDHIHGFCRQGDSCEKSHQLCLLENGQAPAPTLESGLNQLSALPRLQARPFEDDGPGILSMLGPRHDNDHVEIRHIQILPTADEILSRRPPYMPSRDPQSPHRLPLGQDRLLDINFRQLRYEHVESIIDCCYHASQQLSQFEGYPRPTDYDERCRTPKGSHYSLFQDVAFEETIFHDQKGMMLRVSFACPSSLRGRRLLSSSHFEKGMLIALIGFVDEAGLSVTFMETFQRQSTEAMRRRTGNDMRASIVLSFAETMDICGIRRLLYNFRGLLKETFVLVELPGALFAGFRWTLQELKLQSSSARGMAFESTIAPSSAFHNPSVSPPDYSMQEGFKFELDILRKDSGLLNRPALTLKPAEILSHQVAIDDIISQVCDQTNLDHGQATALCESLCRSLAFTQGPPGTGKTFLGVALARVLLASRPSASRRPILVTCLTNHALDSFLSGLCEAGIASFIRFGSNSKENWTEHFQKRNVSKRFKRTPDERARMTNVNNVAEIRGTECQSWCEALNNDALSWPAVREYLHAQHPDILSQFTAVEKTDQLKVSDIRLARKAGGFAFEYWCQGGDIRDVDLLLETFQTILGNDTKTSDIDARAPAQHDRVVDNIRWNIAIIQDTKVNTDIWELPVHRREELFQQWKHEIGLEIILDRTAEAHRRHQAAIAKKRKVYEEIDIRMLESMDVIAMTTTACAMHRSTMDKLGVQIVMCEEAGEVMEAQLLCTLLPSVSHHISIGDPLQLRPQVNEQNLSLEVPQASKYRLDESLMERLMLPKTPDTRPIPSSTLIVQCRMHPEIADLMRATMYPFLQDHESTWKDRSIHGMADRIWWFDHQAPEGGGDLLYENPTSFSNTFEVEMIAGLVHYLMDSNEYDYKDITILTPYSGQLAALASRLKGRYSLWLSEKDRETLCNDGLLAPEDLDANAQTDIDVGDMLRLATIDNFQGEESKIVILSTVRSNGSGRVGFMKTTNRINVACSRARHGFYIVGNAMLMNTVPMWHRVTTLLASKEKIGSAIRTCCPRHPDIIHYIQEPQEWYEIPPCQMMCDFEFPCGHRCDMTCHASSLHDRVGCTQPCERIFERCGHRCSKPCRQPCEECDYRHVSVKLPCGHNAICNCTEVEEGGTEVDMPCNVKVATRTLTCGHEQDILCSKESAAPTCRNMCGRLLDCGHTCQGNCSSCTQTGQHSSCEETCRERNPICGHECLSKCHPGSTCLPCQHPCPNSCKHGQCPEMCGTECRRCMKKCDWKCQHEGQCSSLCCLPCTRFPCRKMCAQVLPCGHHCPSLCGEACPNICLHCDTGRAPEKPRMFLPCGHSFEVEELDSHVGLRELYDIDENYRFREVKISASGKRNINATCPECGESCASIRRYAFGRQLETFPSVLDSICGRFGRKFSQLLDLMYSTKLRLDSSFRTFRECLMPGPLNGRKNELKIRERTNALDDLQESILGSRDNVVTPFELAMASLADFLPRSCSFHTSVLSVRVRLETISGRCKLIILEERQKIIQVLETFTEHSYHTLLLVKGLRGLTLTEASRELSLLGTLVNECETKNLKRLECEARLICTCVQIVIYKLGANAANNVVDQQNFQKAQDLCHKFPASAGLLLPICMSVQRAMNPTRKENQTFYAWEFKSVFWSWPKHQIGALTKCPRGHIYSGFTWSDCPECGPEVRIQDKLLTTPLQTDAFILAMRARITPAKFDANAYRRQALGESKNHANRLLLQKAKKEG